MCVCVCIGETKKRADIMIDVLALSVKTNTITNVYRPFVTRKRIEICISLRFADRKIQTK